MIDLAVKTVTKTKCDALVVSETGTQSNKARDPERFAKPVFTSDEFLTWAER